MSNLFDQARARLSGSPAMIPERLRSYSGRVPTLAKDADGANTNAAVDPSAGQNAGLKRPSIAGTCDSGLGSSTASLASSDGSSDLLTTNGAHAHKRGQPDVAATTVTTGSGSASSSTAGSVSDFNAASRTTN
ncbi:LANO_0E03422g1_1 [Lachancea nothofagi CBS 11611]|uniref:LANO_0E03422g1_1 n=1 Tax=Lachancea nothofagi CBS 11611 TaxID=1266666 RepID=A0A1G4JRB1_9SACH|nr:LANO_0E03422g1_1 [Lachancea nothofagi CBS 11611]